MKSVSNLNIAEYNKYDGHARNHYRHGTTIQTEITCEQRRL